MNSSTARLLRMRTRLRTLLLPLAFAACSRPSPSPAVDASTTAGLDSLNARLARAYRTRDPVAYGALFTDSAVFEWPSTDPVRGPAALAAMARSNWAGVREMDLRLTVAARRIAAGQATEFGAFVQPYRDADDTARTEYGRYAAVLLRQPDGSWRMDRFLGFSDSTRLDVARGTPAAPAGGGPNGGAPNGGAPAVTERGIGPLRVGMSLAEARAAVGVSALAGPPAADTATCGYVAWRGGPPGVRLMLERGRVVRADVDSSAVKTAAGAGVGDDEAHVRALYGSRVTSTPAKYGAGHTLTVAPMPADSGFALVFETRGGRVTRYRAGRRPQVEYVEGCG